MIFVTRAKESLYYLEDNLNEISFNFVKKHHFSSICIYIQGVQLNQKTLNSFLSVAYLRFFFKLPNTKNERFGNPLPNYIRQTITKQTRFFLRHLEIPTRT